ncbi:MULTISPECIES: glycosyltransferase 87 family protein [unclassified Isoptericola]|uniref:glycosyltransferase 87 family protein n=1 Tax=unclassified Isoptericola TaxID=2623355 RepID=UPI003649CDF1
MPTTQPLSAPSAPGPVGAALRSRWLLALGFVVVHAWVVKQAITWGNTIYGDVTLYEWWARHGLTTGQWPVLDYDWVYPAGALVPVTLPALLSTSVLGYEIVWTAMVVALDAVATVVLVRSAPRGVLGAWWWLAFLVALGPIFVGRLDGVVAPLILVALVVASRRPALATAIATAGAWIKIAPGAVVVALAATRARWRDLLRHVVVPGAAVSVVVVGLALAGGAGERAFSVFGQQEARTLQAESVLATWFSVARLWDPTVRIEYNDVIYTYEVQGEAARQVASTLDVLLPVAVLLLAALTWWTAHRRPDHAGDILLLSTTALLLALIVFNKVGSPQFVAWIGPPLAAALALAGRGTRRLWGPPAVGALLAALGTQIVYPVAYGEFLAGEPAMIVVEGLRNLALVVLLVGAVWRIAQLGRDGVRDVVGDDVPA